MNLINTSKNYARNWPKRPIPIPVGVIETPIIPHIFRCGCWNNTKIALEVPLNKEIM